MKDITSGSVPTPTEGRKRITTTIKRHWLNQILLGKKHIEYREIKPYWTRLLLEINAPFELRLINGMSKKAPEATLLISAITTAAGQYELHISEILYVKNWSPERGTL